MKRRVLQAKSYMLSSFCVKPILFTLIGAMLAFSSFSQDYTKEVIELWENEKIPYNKDVITVTERTQEGAAWRNINISNPLLYVYRSNEATKNGAAMLCCPGGGYSNVSLTKDGKGRAEYFLKMGFSVVAVLKYRLPDTAIVYSPDKVPLCDAQKALSILHKNAKIWNVKRNKIAIIGSSAGGHLAASLANLNDSIYAPGVKPKELKLAASVLMYPVISFNLPYRHKGSYKKLLGEKMNDSLLLNYYSMENQVSKKTPPTFLVHALDDKSVVHNNSLIYAEKLKEYGIKHKVLLVEKGGHGFHFNPERTGVDWGENMKVWLLNNTNLLED